MRSRPVISAGQANYGKRLGPLMEGDVPAKRTSTLVALVLKESMTAIVIREVGVKKKLRIESVVVVEEKRARCW